MSSTPIESVAVCAMSFPSISAKALFNERMAKENKLHKCPAHDLYHLWKPYEDASARATARTRAYRVRFGDFDQRSDGTWVLSNTPHKEY